MTTISARELEALEYLNDMLKSGRFNLCNPLQRLAARLQVRTLYPSVNFTRLLELFDHQP